MSAERPRAHRIAVVPGDGIGREVTPQAVSALEAAAGLCGFALETEEFPWGCDYYARHGVMMPSDALESLAAFDAILLGAVGSAEVGDHIPIWELVLPIRLHFDQYVNLRPIRLASSHRWPAAAPPTST